MGDQQADLRHFYETEARLRRRGPLRGRRVDLRNDFIDLLGREGRRSVIDFGAGPGLDGQAFLAAGHRFVGIDLAKGNGRLAAEKGVTVVQGSIAALPVRPGSFDAGWCLSTLMHLTETEASAAIGQMLGGLRPGAPLLVGLWGSEDERTVIDDTEQPGSRRPFDLRSLERNRSILAARADVEWASRWETAEGGWDYHVFRLRLSGEHTP